MEKDVGLAIVVERMRAASVASAHSPLGTPGRMTGRTPAGTAALGRHFFPVEDIVVPTPVAAPAAAPGASDVAASSGVVASSGAAPLGAAVALSVSTRSVSFSCWRPMRQGETGHVGQCESAGRRLRNTQC